VVRGHDKNIDRLSMKGKVHMKKGDVRPPQESTVKRPSDQVQKLDVIKEESKENPRKRDQSSSTTSGDSSSSKKVRRDLKRDENAMDED
jgi:hypothetical protein